MRASRLRLLVMAALAGGAALMPFGWAGQGSAVAFYQSPQIPLFATPLRVPGQIPVALQDAAKAPTTGVTHYTLDIEQFQDQILPSGFPKTTLWGFNPTIGLLGNTTPTHLGGLLIGEKGKPIQVTFRNKLLVNRHILPVDRTIRGADKVGDNRTSVHLHGGLVPWISDGGPFAWFDPHGNHGESFLNNQVLNPSAPPGSAEYYYPMNQSARFMWYHDHALAITRLNAYAGIASGVLLRDAFEAGLVKNKGLPQFVEAGGNELPIVIQDKIFVGKDIRAADPTWTGLDQPGSLWYAHTYDPSRWDLLAGGKPVPDPSVVPEFFGDTMLVNGTAYPEATVQARRYRLRMLNACNARFVNLQLYLADKSPEGITLDESGNPTNQPFLNHATGDTPHFLQVGTEGGFLSKPAKVASDTPLVVPESNNGGVDPSRIKKSLLVAPAERPDIIVDFSNYQPGTEVILYNDAPAPFPGGDPVNDYFPGFHNDNPVNQSTKPGHGPNTRVLMRFHIVAAQPPGDAPLALGTGTDLTAGIDPSLVPWGDTAPPPVRTRFLSLDEYHDEFGRLVQILGDADAPLGSPYFGDATYLDYGLPPGMKVTKAATQEIANAGDTEVWEIFNTTADVHPIHFHLTNVQLIDRQLFDPLNFPFVPSGPVIPPQPNELGWKETVQMYPGTVTRVIMKFDLSKARIVAADGKVIPTPRARGPAGPNMSGIATSWNMKSMT